MTAAKKIVALAASTLCLSMALGTLNLVSLSRIDSQIDSLVSDNLPGVQAIGTISAKVFRFRGDAWKHIASHNPQQMAAVEQDMTGLKREIEEQLVEYGNAITQDDDRAHFTLLKQELDRYYRAWETVLPISRQSRNEEAFKEYLAQVDPAFTALRDTLQTMQKWNKDDAFTTSKAAVSTSKSATLWTWIVMFSSVALGCVVSFVIIRGLNASLRQFASELSQGAIQVAAAASQVASSSQSLAEGASEQAAALEETSASSEEIRSMAQKNTEHTSSARELVERSGHRFEETNELLNGMLASMSGITTSSEKISKIIKIIDEIAFQTNILALNAAVEAARAGEAGMGFAVVADEVRNLAHRSAQAAKDTAALIEESITKSSEGKSRVDQVATAVRAITEEAGKVKVLVDDVNLGSQEQTRGMDEVAKAITEMQEVTQRTAANAEESAAAATELLAQSERLKETVSGLAALVGTAASTV